ncbi:MAG: hypothetical protein AB1489_35235 [Acidobacteriota bacterium]
MRIKYHLYLAIGFLALLLITGLWLWYKWGAVHEIDEARKQLAAARLLEFTTINLPAVNSPEIALFHNLTSVRDLIRTNDSFFAATAGGLVEYSQDGQLKHHYTTLNGLPTNDLIALATYQGQLFIGSGSGNLISFDGERFTEFRFNKQQPQRINSLATGSSRLVLGSAGLGLVEYDGNTFIRTRENGMFTCAVESAGVDYFGTFADGLWIRRAGRWLHTGRAEGLPSDRIVGIAVLADQVYVATDFGIARLEVLDIAGEQMRARTLAVLPGLASIVTYKDQIYICRDNGELFYFTLPNTNNTHLTLNALVRRWPLSHDCRLRVIDNNLFLLTANGIWLATGSADFTQGEDSFRRFDHITTPTLTDNMVSALALDTDGRLWAGLFSGGIDILTQNGQLIKHIETEALREINYLRWDATSQRMLTATSAGLFEIDRKLHLQRLTIDNGLLSNSINQIGFVPATTLVAYMKPQQDADSLLAIATARGFSIGSRVHLQSYTTLQGLPSNSVYTIANIGRKLFVGTLAGIAVIEGGRVVRTYKQSNSRLSANWVTALLNVDDKLFIGTYGGGVDLLTASGEIENLHSQIGKFEVNLNAIAADRTHLFVGTLDSGLWICELANQQWRQIKAGLPSANVMAIASNPKYIFVATQFGLARITRE